MQLPDIAAQQLWQLCWAMSMFDRGRQHPPLSKQQQVTWLPAMRHAELIIAGVGEVLMAAALPQDRGEGAGRSIASLLHRLNGSLQHHISIAAGKLRDCLLATAEQLHLLLSSAAL